MFIKLNWNSVGEDVALKIKRHMLRVKKMIISRTAGIKQIETKKHRK